jgi:hypothetical protein
VNIRLSFRASRQGIIVILHSEPLKAPSFDAIL